MIIFWIIFSLIILFTLAIIYGVFIEPKWFFLSRYNIKVDKPLPQPLKILHLSDTHFHPKNRHIDKMFDKLEKLKDEIDIVFLTGDIIDNDNGIELAKAQLSRLKPNCGIYAVLGNHDHFWYGYRELLRLFFWLQTPKAKNDIKRLKTTLELIGCHILVNEVRTVSFYGTNILIAGLDDPVTRQDNPENIAPSEDPKQLRVLLVHLLDAFHKVINHHYDLAFSGHTHGGQVRIPFLGPVVTHSKLHRKFTSGLNRINGTQIFTSRGIGTSPQARSRLFCHPEATIITVQGN